MEDKDKNLESFFKRNFNLDATPEEWNTPNNDVWHNIERSLKYKNSNRRILFFLPWILAMVFALLSVLAWNKNRDYANRINSLESQIKNCVHSQVNNVEDTKKGNLKYPLLPSENIDSTTLYSSEKVVNEDVKTTSETPKKILWNYNGKAIRTTNKIDIKLENKNFTNKADTTINRNEESFRHEIDIKNNQGLYTNQSDYFLLDTASSTLPLKTNKKYTNDKIDIIPYLKNILIIKMEINSEKVKMQPYSGIKLSREIQIKKPFLLVGPSVIGSNWIDRVSDEPTLPFSELLLEEKTETSLNFGIQSKFALSRRLTADIGFYISQRNHKSVFMLNIPYNLKNEISSGINEKENHFEHTLPTGLGEIKTDLTLQRNSNTPISDNEIINLDFSMDNQSTLFIIPTAISYFPTTALKGFYFTAGFQHEFSIRNNPKHINILSHHTYVKEKEIIVQYKDNQLNKYNIGLLGGLGYQTILSPNWYLSLSGNYNHSLSNTYSKESYKHKIDQIGIQIAILKSFF